MQGLVNLGSDPILLILEGKLKSLSYLVLQLSTSARCSKRLATSIGLPSRAA